MKIMDKISAKRLGISVEDYREKVKMAQEIWNNLYMERKIIDPSSYHHKDIRLCLSDSLFYLIMLYVVVLVVILTLGFEVTKYYFYPGIFLCVLYLIGKFLIYKHDINQFNKRVEEIAEWEEEHGEAEDWRKGYEER